MKFLCTLSRIVIGLLFIFSGLTKAIDPVGFGFVMAEYLKALGLQFFTPLAITGGIALSAFEFLLGASLLVGLQVRLSAFFSMLIMVFFTFFTLWVAIVNPVQHCGCFGDVIHLSNWETFFKNLIFTPFTLLLVWQRKRFEPVTFKKWEWGTIAIFGIASVLLSLHCYRHLPLMDFTGFKTGNNIPQAMTIPEGAPLRQYQTTFTYQKDSKTQTFTLDQLPDSSWTYVSHKTKLIHAGTIPEIPQFDISTYRQNRYVTDSLLAIKGYLLALSLPYADKAKAGAIKKAALLSQEVAGIPFIVISGSGEGQTAALLQEHGLDAPAYFLDAKVLYTMVRSNPGLSLLYDATVVAKWSAFDIPSPAALKQLMGRDWEVAAAKSRIRENLTIEIMAIGLLLLFALLHSVFHRHHTRKSNRHDTDPSVSKAV